MKKILAFVMAVAVLASLMAVSFTVSAAYEENYAISVDDISGKSEKNADQPGKHYEGSSEIAVGDNLTVTGWVVMESGFAKLQYAVDGGAWNDVTTTYAERPDVIAHVKGAYPEIDYESTNDKPGFGTATLGSVASLAKGEYVIKVQAVDKNGGAVEILSVDLTIGDGVVVPDPTVINLDTNADIYYYNDGKQGSNPFNFQDGKPSAVQFKIPAGKDATQLVFVNSPNWGNPTGAGADVLVKLYSWKGDYESSVAVDPIDSLQIYGHADNSNLVIQFSNNISAGEYVITLDANGGKAIGTWAAAAGDVSATFYTGGQVKEGYIPFFAAMLVDAKDAPAPQTGDVSVAVLAVLSVVALAAVAVFRKRVNG